jgi:hypothetical protein
MRKLAGQHTTEVRMRRSLVTFAGMLGLGLCLALSAPGVEVERCDASRQSCSPEAPAARAPRVPAACEARPHEIDVRTAEAAVRRAREALAARVADTGGDVVPLGGSGYNYQPLPTRPRR